MALTDSYVAGCQLFSADDLLPAGRELLLLRDLYLCAYRGNSVPESVLNNAQSVLLLLSIEQAENLTQRDIRTLRARGMARALPRRCDFYVTYFNFDDVFTRHHLYVKKRYPSAPELNMARIAFLRQRLRETGESGKCYNPESKRSAMDHIVHPPSVR